MAPDSARRPRPGALSHLGTMQTILHCTHKGCRNFLAVLPGRWIVSRALDQSERVPESSGVLICRQERDRMGRIQKGCGARYEVKLIALPAQEAA